jgi:hypothetical protein
MAEEKTATDTILDIAQYLNEDKLKDLSSLALKLSNISEDLSDKEMESILSEYCEKVSPIDFCYLFFGYNAIANLIKSYYDFINIKIRTDISMYISDQDNKDKLLKELDIFIKNNNIGFDNKNLN